MSNLNKTDIERAVTCLMLICVVSLNLQYKFQTCNDKKIRFNFWNTMLVLDILILYRFIKCNNIALQFRLYRDNTFRLSLRVFYGFFLDFFFLTLNV